MPDRNPGGQRENSIPNLPTQTVERLRGWGIKISHQLVQ